MSRVRAPRVPSPMGSRGSKHGCRPRWVQDLPVLPLPRTSNASHGMRSLTYRPVELPLFVHGQVEAGVHRPDGHNADTHRPDLDDACGAGKRCCEMGHLLQGPFPRCPQGVTTQGQHRRPQKSATAEPHPVQELGRWTDGWMDGCCPNGGTVGSKGCVFEGEPHHPGGFALYSHPPLCPAAPGSRALLE